MIPYARHSINNKDIESVIKVLKSDWLTTGPAVEEFENELQKYTDGTPVVSLSSGTAALHAAYYAAGIEQGDEIITPPNTFIATQAAAALWGAKIIFSDILTDTGNIDPNLIESKITNNTKAIVAVDYAGHPCDLDEIKNICDKNNLIFIEDASHSFGSKYKDKYVGSIADITTFSFFATKNITTGEGGAVASPNKDLLEKVKKFARQGIIRDKDKFKIPNFGPWHQEVHKLGLNYRLSDIHAALGTSQLKRFFEFKSKRELIFSTYNKYFQGIEEIILPVERHYVDTFWHLYPLKIRKDLRLDFYNYLKNNKILAQINYFPVNEQPVFQSNNNFDCKNSFEFYESEISLPLFTNLSEDELDFIIKTVLRYFAK